MKEFEKLCKNFNKIQGVGKKTALKMAYHLCYENKNLLEELAHSLKSASSAIKECEICGALCEDYLCDECLNEDLEKSVCLVESAKDIFFLKDCNAYEGRYFVFAKANEYYLKKLENMINKYNIQEIIIAYTPSVSTDALCFYLENYFINKNLSISKIAQGIPNGVKIQDIDQSSLSSAILNRVKFT
ncbi:recombination protein RecR [Campylobacter canadensis]|uniref:Recombination protein RecR n=1 Tax=Campylobacter canadensis TaxID=449520 RepID=A0ABS7WPU0_9BACT|nr:recombination protein RecR [Campylobacter canadensis]MBZ7986775.1 recombination protein RecR [Campylobacter canadensis]MBZ7997108.1 recombination protein RecR [Campylobacter canadensis]MBZ7997812.1 recombination protein RecR [Campylobacter canadensis]MBZ7999866.1 recombination protein RecR [Campylobacter canadensis]MBZ8001806.1 recombination protein RecR [Campylobacter canadensis]